MIIKRRPY